MRMNGIENRLVSLLGHVRKIYGRAGPNDIQPGAIRAYLEGDGVSGFGEEIVFAAGTRSQSDGELCARFVWSSRGNERCTQPEHRSLIEVRGRYKQSRRDGPSNGHRGPRDTKSDPSLLHRPGRTAVRNLRVTWFHRAKSERINAAVERAIPERGMIHEPQTLRCVRRHRCAVGCSGVSDGARRD